MRWENWPRTSLLKEIQIVATAAQTYSYRYDDDVLIKQACMLRTKLHLKVDKTGIPVGTAPSAPFCRALQAQ